MNLVTLMRHPSEACCSAAIQHLAASWAAGAGPNVSHYRVLSTKRLRAHGHLTFVSFSPTLEFMFLY